MGKKQEQKVEILAAVTSAISTQYTPKTLAPILHRTPNALNALRVRGTGPKFTRQGRRVFYDARDVQAWLDSLPRFTAGFTKAPKTRKSRKAA